MRLAPDTSVIALAGIADTTGSRNTAQSALDVTASAVSDKLGTQLEKSSYVDVFTYEIPRYQTAFERRTLRLSAGFIDDTTLVVRTSSDGLPISIATDGEDVPVANYRLDPELGLLTLLADVTKGYQTLVVAYEAGFTVDSETGVLDGIPDWLKQAGTVAAVKLIQTQPLNIAKTKGQFYAQIQSALAGEASSVLNPHIRPRMGYQFPDRTSSALV